MNGTKTAPPALPIAREGDYSPSGAYRFLNGAWQRKCLNQDCDTYREDREMRGGLCGACWRELQDASRAACDAYLSDPTPANNLAHSQAQRAYTALLFPMMAESGKGKRFYDDIEAARAAQQGA